MISSNVLSLAYYLPQFHEIEENNLWWGKGFTEWTNLRDAQLYFSWHKIRRPIPPFAEYNLLNPRVMEWQAKLAKSYGINGFMVFDYWFGAGKTLLEKPLQIALEKHLDFDYCFCWANHSWFNKRDNMLLIEQKYLGQADYIDYFYRLLPYFKSSHYIKIANKPIFAIFNPKDIPDIRLFVNTFQSLAVKEGFPGLYLIGENTDQNSDYAAYFDRYTKSARIFKDRIFNNPISSIKEKLTRKFNYKQLGPFCYDYASMVVKYTKQSLDQKNIPIVFTGWDTTPRHKKRGTIFRDFDVVAFRNHLATTRQALQQNNSAEKLIIIKSWNEWAEGNVLEPDTIFGYSLLEEYAKFVASL